MKRILIIGDIHFVDENGHECDPEIETVDLAVELDDDEDADVIGEMFIEQGHTSYTTLEGEEAENYKGQAIRLMGGVK